MKGPEHALDEHLDTIGGSSSGRDEAEDSASLNTVIGVEMAHKVLDPFIQED